MLTKEEIEKALMDHNKEVSLLPKAILLHTDKYQIEGLSGVYSLESLETNTENYVIASLGGEPKVFGVIEND